MAGVNIIFDTFVNIATLSPALAAGGSSRGWIDKNGGLLSYSSAQGPMLISTDNSGGGKVLRDWFVRGDTFLNGSITATFAAYSTADISPGVMARGSNYGASGSMYYFTILNTGTWTLYRVASGTSTALATGSITGWSTTHSYKITLTLSGTTTTSITYQVVDVTNANTTVLSSSFSDTSGLTTAGAWGMNMQQSTGTASNPQNASVVSCLITNNDVTYSNAVGSGAFFDPYNWAVAGDAISMINNFMPGSYVKFRFSGTKLYMFFTNNNCLNTTSGLYDNLPVQINVSIDNGAYQTFNILPQLQQGLQIATGLANTTHSVRWWVNRIDHARNYWTQNYTILGGFATDGSILAPTNKRAKTMLVFGDESVIGVGAGGNPTSGALHLTYDDGTESWVQQLGLGFSAEVSQVGYQGQGYTQAAPTTGAPAVTSSWNLVNSAFSRLVSGKFSPIPDYILVIFGKADALALQTPATVQSAIQTLLTSLRGAVNRNTPIIFTDTLTGLYGPDITQAAIKANNDPFGYGLDVYTNGLSEYPFQAVAEGSGTATFFSADGVNPATAWTGLVSSVFTQRIMQGLTGSLVPPRLSGGGGMDGGF